MTFIFLIFVIIFQSYLDLFCNAEKKAVIQLAFGIMTYEKASWGYEKTLKAFNHLMDIIYDPNKHVYVLHVDIKLLI